MITVQLNKPNFEYDIHSLIKAFYPSEEVAVSAEKQTCLESTSLSIEIIYNEFSDRTDAFGQKPESIRFAFSENERKLEGEAEVDFSDRKETKNLLKQKLYGMLSEFTGKQLPWGTLTGIRPAKIPMSLLEKGETDESIRHYMKQTYFASDEKIALCLEVAKNEQKLLERIDYENGFSLYVGIPFCPSTCLYCSFTSYPISVWKNRIQDYLDALEKEIRFTASMSAGKKLNTVYIGGGTPTSLQPEELERLLSMLEQNFDYSELLEFTVEAGRPDSITAAKLEVLKKHGVTRISINPQTMKQETLDIIGRHHTVAQTAESFRLARSLGFDNINMDLIVGLPEETIDDVRATLEQITALAPDNVTVHSLAVKRAARLRMNREEYQDMSFENTWDTIALTEEYCRKMGMQPYYLYRQKNIAGNFENVGYAKPGQAGLYNVLIMEEKQTIIALGAGASTKFVSEQGAKIERVENVKDVTNYIDRIDEMLERKKKGMEEQNWL